MPRRPIFRAERRAIDRKIDKVKGQQLVTIGDRLFRVGNTKKAEERFEQAAKSSPDDAAPFVRLAQVEFLRGDYADAAERFRQHDANLGLPVRGELVDDPVHRGRRGRGVKSSEDEMAGLGRLDGDRHRFEVAHLAYENDVRVFSESRA